MNPYDVLGVSRQSSSDEIKKAYRKLAMVHHPDKGGDESKFKEINEAYSILSDDQKKHMYDTTGRTDMNQMGGNPFEGGHPFGSGHPFGNIFEHLFKGGRPGGEAPKTKCPDKEVTLPITLEDIYKGVTKKLNVQLSGPCSCRTHCQKCNGEGKIQMVQMIGPFQQVIQTQCQECNGQGRSRRKSDCKECNQEGNYTKSEHITVDIPRATSEDWTYRVPNLGYQPINKNELPGDLVIRLKADEHYFFTREGNHLVTRCSVSMKEALCGTIIECPHFGGSFLIDTSILGVLEKGKKYIIKEKGLTIRDDLFIYFTVDYPKLSDEKRKKIRELLEELNL